MSKKEMQANQQPDTQPIEEQATPHEDNVEAQDDLQLLIKKDKNAQITELVELGRSKGKLTPRSSVICPQDWRPDRHHYGRKRKA